ncbi:MAG: response regulator [Oscillospiraceae bacterium]|nr:response regulator [Oscillospiraceae bacterium]
MKLLLATHDPKTMETAKNSMLELTPDADLLCCDRVETMLSVVQIHPIDISVLDLDMPGMDGFTQIKKIETLRQNSNIVVLTADVGYALEAHQHFVSAFLLKPVRAEHIENAMKHLRNPIRRVEPLRIRCFGYFDVFYNGKPLLFTREKAKELLAYLVDQAGHVCTDGELVDALWEETRDFDKCRNYLRVLTSELRIMFSELGYDNILMRKNKQWAINPGVFYCDYYQLLAGSKEAYLSFHDEYMVQYSWAETTAGKLHFLMEH